MDDGRDAYEMGKFDDGQYYQRKETDKYQKMAEESKQGKGAAE